MSFLFFHEVILGELLDGCRSLKKSGHTEKIKPSASYNTQCRRENRERELILDHLEFPKGI